MDLSGIIFVVLALAWAVYLIPKALKHHDEIARTRSIDRFSTAMRVLARREPVNRRDSRLVVTPPRPSSSLRMLVPNPAAAAVAAVEASAPAPASEEVRRIAGRPAARRMAARAAARRRRRILLFLVVVDLAVVGVAVYGLLPWWSVAIPGPLAPGYLLLCRRQVRRENAALRSQPEPAPAEAPGEAEVAPRRAVRVDAPYGTLQSSRDVQASEQAAAGLDSVPVSAAGMGSLWDPLPVTLPTYVSKPKAARTVRTIDLSEPGTWTSGRSEADSQLVEEAAAAQEAAAAGQEDQHAVGS